jgi:hypothetical protein
MLKFLPVCIALVAVGVGPADAQERDARCAHYSNKLGSWLRTCYRGRGTCLATP